MSRCYMCDSELPPGLAAGNSIWLFEPPGKEEKFRICEKCAIERPWTKEQSAHRQD
jgi:hypothetical protein